MVSQDTHLGDETINEHQEGVLVLLEGEGLRLGQTHSWASGVAGQALRLHLRVVTRASAF